MHKSRSLAACSLLVVALTASRADAQVLSVTNGPGFPLVRIDASTGAIVPLLATGVMVAYEGLNAFDPQGRRLFFLTGSIGAQQLVTVDIATGALTSVSIPNPASYVFFEFDQTTGRVLALTNAAGYPLLSIDPVTGAVQTLVATNASSVSPGPHAIDNINRKLHFLTSSDMAASQLLVSVDLVTHAIASVPIPSPDDYIFFQYDNVSGRVIGVTNGTGYPVVSIDPATGSVVSLLQTGATSGSSGLSAFDPLARRLYFLAGSVGSQVLVAVSLDSLLVTTTSIASADSYIFFDGDFAATHAIPTLNAHLLLVLTMVLAAIGLRVTS